MTTRVPIIRNRGEGDQQFFHGGGVHTWKLTSDDTDGAFFLFEDVMEKGKTTPLHLHPAASETMIVLEGEVLHQADGVEHRVGAGGITFVPKGVEHAFIVVSDTARVLAIQTPGIGQAFFRDASDDANAEADATRTADFARLLASAEANRTAIKILGPSPYAAASVS